MSAKISALDAILGSSITQLEDILPIVDTSVTETKKILVSELSLAMHRNGTEQATTSGSSKQFDIPAWASRVVMSLKGVSIDTTGFMRALASPVTSVYGSLKNSAGTVVATLSSTFYITQPGTQTAAMVMEGDVIFTRFSETVWMVKSFITTSNAATDVYTGAGRIVLSGPLTSVSIGAGIPILAPANFDAGAVNVYYH